MVIGVKPPYSNFEPMKTLRTSRLSRPRRLTALGWVFAWMLLAIQGVAVAAPQCDLADVAAGMEAYMPDTNDPSAMPMSVQPDANPSDCQHCHSHTQAHGCLGFHGCSAQLALFAAPLISLRFPPLPLNLLPAGLPRLSSLSFDPPLRPPSA